MKFSACEFSDSEDSSTESETKTVEKMITDDHEKNAVNELTIDNEKNAVNELTIEFPPNKKNNSDNWEEPIIFSKCNNYGMKTRVLLASFDQMRTDGHGACSVIAALCADWLLSAGAELPTELDFDRLILEGSNTWRDLKRSATLADALNNFFFHIDDIVKAGIGSIAIDYGRTRYALFSPDAGDGSVDDVWDKLVAEEDYPRVYIVRWNNHFFVLKIESEDVCYVMDSLGNRFSNLWARNKGYIVRFDPTSLVAFQEPSYSFPWVVGAEGSGSCLEFLKKFMVMQSLGGRGWHEVGTEMTQIDFNYVHREAEPPATGADVSVAPERQG